MKNNRLTLSIKQELARRNYIDYCRYVHRGFWRAFDVHKLICNKLEDVLSGKTKRLIIQMPPRHGKSMTVTETFPSYFLLKNPDKQVIQISYSGDLAEDFGEKNRDKFSEYGLELFGLEVSKKKAAKAKWGIEGKRGRMISAGVGGPVTGKGADLLIIDDPIKNREEAESETYREKLWNEWTSTLRTRLHKDAAVIVIQTRWHEDDLAGRLITQGGWEVISLPAICEDDNDLLNRNIGDTLCPELGFDIEWALQTQRDVGTRTWTSLYQQRPSPADGNIFKRDWFCYYNQNTLPKTFDEITQSWDMAFKDTNSSDFVACGVWGKKGANHYLLHRLKERLSFVETVKAMIKVTNLYPKATLKLVEDKANGPAVISALRKKIHGIVAVNPGKDSKESRAYAVTPLFEAGNVFIPDYAEWKEDYIEELVAFPNAAHDDQVDQTTQYLKRHITASQAIQMNTNMFGNDDDDWIFN